MSADDTFPTPPPAPGDLVAGAVVGSWRVERELGRGGMGTVYAVHHVDIGKSAALKVVHREMLDASYGPTEVLTEARVVNAFSHPNVVDIFESGTMADGRPFLVMERLRGRTLGDRHAESRVPALEAIDYLIPVCDALAAAHAAGIVHRDIKLDNIFLAEDRGTKPGVRGMTVVKLVDWGVASITEGGRSTDALTIGTPRYVAPEQIKGEGVTSASDIYALGVVAYELFLEEPPFNASTTSELLLAHVNDAPPPPREVWPRIPTRLEVLLLSMLRKEPCERPTAAEVGATLAEIRDQLRASMTIAPPRARARTAGPRGTDPTLDALEAVGQAPGRRWRWFAAAAAVVTLLGARAFLRAPEAGAAATTAAIEAPMPVPVASAAAASPELALVAAPELVRASDPEIAGAPRASAVVRASHRASHPSSARASTRATPRPASARRLHPDSLIEPY